MDKIRPIISVLGKYHFWILSALVGVLTLAVWHLAAAGLDDQRAKNVTQIKTYEGNMQRIAGESDHPNEDTIKKINEDTVEQGNKVFRLWEDLYGEQREKVLRWPNVFYPEFYQEVENKDFGTPLSLTVREDYNLYIKQQVPKLAEIIDATKLDPNTGQPPQRFPTGLENGGGGEAEVDPYVVSWVEDQSRLLQYLDWDRPPGSTRMWVAQEDLWVYQTLLEIIRQTNMLDEQRYASGPYNAAVKEIIQMQVGAEAAKQQPTGRILFLGQRAAAGGMMGGGLEDEGGGMRGMGGGPGAMGYGSMGAMGGMNMEGEGGFGRGGAGAGGVQMTEEMEAQILLSGRYLDESGKPIMGAGAAGGADAADASAAPPSGGGTGADLVPKTEFKRLPILLAVRMDQQKLPKLLVACANAPLPIEVTQVRINPEASMSGGAGGGSGFGGMGRGMMGGGLGRGMMGGGMLGMGDEGGYPGGGYGGGGFGARGITGEEEVNPAVVPVVIHGIVYIYNKPDKQALGVEDTLDQGNVADARDVGVDAAPLQ